MDDLCYVYGVAEAAAVTLPAEGMPHGTAPRALALAADVQAIVSSVPEDAYAAGAIEAKLGDLDWVAAAGAAHHAVIDALAEAGVPVVPFRLFTMFSSDGRALETLRGTVDALRRTFDRVRGREEWVLRIGKPDPARAAQRAPAPARAVSGTSFLEAKAGARRARSARAERVSTDAAEACDALAALAEATAKRAVDPQGTLVLDAAFLVPAGRGTEMKDVLSRSAAGLLDEGCLVSLTGPWPPYSFASMETPGDA